MNKTITIYELLGLIKDGKEPKKIKYGETNFIYIGKENDYYNEKTDNLYLFKDYICTLEDLNEKVEILEEDKPIIEKLKIKDNKVIGKWENGSDYHYTLSAPQVVIINKINEVIDYLNKKEDN